MFKDFLEDYKRWKSDKEENNTQIEKYVSGEFVEATSYSLLVGEIIRIKKDKFIPSDILLIDSSDKRKG